jgi:hypothetical protein
MGNNSHIPHFSYIVDFAAGFGLGGWMNSLLCKAILEKKVVRFYYAGGYRLAEPHCYGVSKDGNELLRVYQIGGYSESNNPSGWKLLRLDEISNLSSTEDSFPSPRPAYNPNDPAMASIYSRL